MNWNDWVVVFATVGLVAVVIYIIRHVSRTWPWHEIPDWVYSWDMWGIR